MKTNSVKVLIVEDEYITQKTITLYLEESGYNVVGATMNYDETLHLLNTTEIDLVLLDITIKGEKSGIDIGNLIHNHYSIPHIYLTAYSDESTVKNAISTMPYAYLVKPFTKTDLFVAIETAMANFNSKKELPIKKDFIFLKHKEFHVKINLEEINYIESQKNYLLLYTESEVYKYRSTLTDFKPKLPNHFIQIHKGFMVNKHKINGYNSNYMLVNDRQLPISRTFKNSVNQLL